LWPAPMTIASYWLTDMRGYFFFHSGS
jgi:hypothetical protein